MLAVLFNVYLYICYFLCFSPQTTMWCVVQVRANDANDNYTFTNYKYFSQGIFKMNQKTNIAAPITT